MYMYKFIQTQKMKNRTVQKRKTEKTKRLKHFLYICICTQINMNSIPKWKQNTVQKRKTKNTKNRELKSTQHHHNLKQHV